MKSPATTTRSLEIDGMSAEACVRKVSLALGNVTGISIRSVSLGSATIEADQAGCAGACMAIGAAGFRTHERARHGQTNASTYAASKTLSEHRPVARSRTPTGADAPDPMCLASRTAGAGVRTSAMPVMWSV